MDCRQPIACRQRARRPAWHAGRALSRRRRWCAVQRLRCLERTDGDLAPSRGRCTARRAQHRRPGLGPRRLQCRWTRSPVLRAVCRHAGRLDAPCRRDPSRSRAGSEAALPRAARLQAGQRRLCTDAVRGAAWRGGARERGPQMHRDRRGPRHRAGRFPRDHAGFRHLVLPRHDVRARRRRPFPQYRLLPAQRAGDAEHARSVDLCRLALVQRSQDEAVARARSRRERAGALGCARPARRDPAPERHQRQRSLFGARLPVAHAVAAVGGVAGRSARRDRPAQHSRHDRRASELAPASAGRARQDRRQGRPCVLEGRYAGTFLARRELIRRGFPRVISKACKTLSQKIEDYALIGDCETAALVGRNGSIDWLCWPAFDSDACFAAILGTRKNGRWLVAPTEDITGTSRRYLGNTLILETCFETEAGTVALIDFMPPRGKASDIVRLVRGVSGKVEMRMELVIRFGFGVDIPWVRRCEDGSLLAIASQDMTVLRTPAKTRGEDLTTIAEFKVSAGETVPFVLTYGPSHLDPPEPIDSQFSLDEQEIVWEHWYSLSTHVQEYRCLCMRWMITLKAFT